MHEPVAILKKFWGYGSFRPMQEDIIRSALDGRDTLALLPTGGGKSICFQVPAMCTEGVCIVVSPLIALMKDQVHNLTRRGIPAIAIFSGMSKREIDIELDNAVHGKYKFLYLSPERLSTEIVLARLPRMKVNLLAIDEAHCISQWGYDFRPPYLQIAEIRPLIPDTPVLALTATATPDVVDDIQDKLAFNAKNVFQKSFERGNLAYIVLREEDKYNRLLRIVDRVKGTGIVYVRSRRRTAEIAQFLADHHVAASSYNAGLDAATRDQRQNDWINDKIRVIVATNAFGMGIDKPDVRFVVHMDLPDTLEAYFQEAGRGGRDGEKAWAIMLYNKADKLELERRIETSFPPEETIRHVYQSLGNYYQLASGAGQGLTLGFDLNEFASRYNFRPIETWHSLKFLEREGLITLSEDINLPSRVRFRLGKEELYRFQVANARHDKFIKLLLRSYTGVFDSYTRIGESQLANRAGMTTSEVVRELIRLKELEVLEYLPRTDQPQLTFLQPRLETKSLRLSKATYKERKDLAFSKMNSVLHFAGSTTKCRSQLLLAYFGERDTYRCGVCDRCLERNKLNLSKLEFDQVLGQVKVVLGSKALTLEELVELTQANNEEQVLKVVQFLLDNGKLILDTQQKLHWNS